MVRAKNHRKYLATQLRNEKIEGGLRWNYYREARDIIVKGLTERNRRINMCVGWIINAKLYEIVRTLEKNGRQRVAQ